MKSDSRLTVDIDHNVGQTTILSSLERLVLTTEDGVDDDDVVSVDPELDLFVYANAVEVRTSLVLPGRKILMVAREIGGVGSASATIDVSAARSPEPLPAPAPPNAPSSAAGGRDGAQGRDGAAGQAGQAGGHAGSIDLWFGDVLSPLTLRANGADGQAGQGGAAGSKGAYGGLGYTSSRKTRRRKNSVVRKPVRVKAGMGGPGGNGGPGGRGGSGGHAGVLIIRGRADSRLRGSLSVLSCEAVGGTGGAGGIGGSGGAGGSSRHRAPAAEGAQGADGEPGIDGRDTPPDLRVLDFVALADHAIASHQAALLQQANLHYLAADPNHRPEGYRRAAELLDWITLSTAAIHEGQAESAERSPECAATLRGVYCEARARLAQLSQGLDAFGNTQDYCPKASLELYADSIQRRLEMLATVEVAHKTYVENLADHRRARAALEDGRRQAEVLAGEFRVEVEQLQAQCADLQVRIEQVHAEVLRRRVQLESSLARFRTKIEGVAGCNIGDVFNAASMLVFLPMMWTGSKAQGGFWGSVGAAVAMGTGGIIERGVRYADVGHGSVPRKLLLGQVELIAKDLKSLSDGYRAHQIGFEVDDAYGQKLMVFQQEFNATLQQYADVVESQSARRAMRDFVDIVARRNALAMEFNELANRQLERSGTIDQLVAQSRQLSQDLARSTQPDLHRMVAFMGGLYHRAVEQVLRHIYQASRALAFWSLEQPRSPFAEIVRADSPAPLDHATLTAAADNLLSAYQSAVEAMRNLPQRFPDAARARATKPRGIVELITDDTHPDELARFRKTGELYVNVRPATPTTSSDESSFAGLANVRLTEVRAWILGAVTATGRLHVTLESDGAEVIVDRHGRPRSFRHAWDRVAFVYRLADDTIEIDGTIGSVSQRTRYASIGPFTRWRLKVEPHLNAGLDLSQVRLIELDFWGACHAFLA
ncbi:hypothetical protein [Enhygromyxa salina]|uniref:Uncharacterized protein n=1 Tax=Enhygromyxa salina TaxID=215803 RepID=A0A2S9YSM4_9BACT|nr:hypothetical protein [Enhygromyxa salina]PRQ08101.1 hypothetical protein ENSA7_20730 [Enhygromyxa salina]